MRIACFHLNQIGDFAFSLPALKSIRDSFPDSVITSVVRPSQREMMESTGLVDEIVCRSGGINLDKLRLARYLASLKFDIAVVFSQSAECAVLSFLSRAPVRVGFINTSLGSLLTKQIDFKHPPSTQNNLHLVETIGGRITQRDYVNLLKPTVTQIDRASKILSDYGISQDDNIVTFSPGTSGRRSVKEWTDEGYAAVGRYLISRGLKVVILGTEPAHGIINGCGDIIDLSGKTNLGEAVAILDRSLTLVAVDSGVLHLCAATGTRVVGLYGPSNHNITGPQGAGHIVVTSGADCSPCVRTQCSNGRKCMLDITADEVISAIDKVIGNG